MARVAANQAKSVEARKQFVYRQQELVAMHQSNGKMTCKQRREYTVTPMADSIERRLVNPPEKNGDVGRCNVDLSGSSGENLSIKHGERRRLFQHVAWKDEGWGAARSFPAYGGRTARLRIQARRHRNVCRAQGLSRDVPPNKRKDASGNQGYWKGEALIDVEEFQPVRVITDLTVGIPLPVRILLGTNVHGIGFTVSYQRLADGVWFPSGFGGSFRSARCSSSNKSSRSTSRIAISGART